MKLIIMGCSATKVPGAAPMRAIDRYDGPMWRSLRARLVELPAASAALKSGELRIYALSARFGFFDAETPIPDYNLLMTAVRIEKMARDCSFEVQQIPGKVDDADAVLFAGGSLYRDAMWKAAGGRLSNIMKISETDAAGIGLHRAQLGAWLNEHFAPAALAKAA
jgi:hypothetical protein